MLKLDNLTYRYKKADKDALKDISAVFEDGKVNAITGSSGSGKTTLLSIMAGLDIPKSGKVNIDGNDISNMDLDLYRSERVSMIFQAFQLFPFLTALENTCYPMETQGISRKEAEEKAAKLLYSVDIDESKHKRYPANLSGGEQQRVAIARALSSGAKTILADEPTGNLDVENGEVVISILRRLAHEEGYCVIIVTHDLDIAKEADVVFRMSDGMVFQHNTY